MEDYRLRKKKLKGLKIPYLRPRRELRRKRIFSASETLIRPLLFLSMDLKMTSMMSEGERCSAALLDVLRRGEATE